jgi:hypothetical protein
VISARPCSTTSECACRYSSPFRRAAHGADGVRRTPRYDRGIPCGSSRSAVLRMRFARVNAETSGGLECSRTIASPPYILGNSRQTPPNINLSIEPNRSLFGLARRSTLICCLSTRFSASSATCDRNRSLAIPKINRHKSSIGYQHRAILSQLPARLNLRQGQVHCADLSLRGRGKRILPDGANIAAIAPVSWRFTESRHHPRWRLLASGR